MSNERERTPTKLIEDILKLLTYTGCNPKIRTVFATIIGSSLGITLLIFVVLNILNLVFATDSFGIIMDNGVLLFGYIQFTIKFYFVMREAKRMSHMLDKVWNDFCSTDSFDTQSKQYLQSLYKMADTISKIYQFAVSLTAFLLVAQAWLKGNRTLLIEIWIPFGNDYVKMSPYFEIIFTVQSILLVLTLFFFISPIDRLFIVLTCSICIQFKMININLLKIGPQNNNEKNIEIIHLNIAHHVRILRFLKIFEGIYSKLFLPTIITTFTGISISLYGFVIEEHLNRKMIHAFVAITGFLQILAYCFAGQFIQDEGLKICDAAYNCIWYDVNNGVQKSLINIMMQSQKSFVISIGGLLDLNIYSFGRVLRASFSFMMFLINSRSDNIRKT